MERAEIEGEIQGFAESQGWNAEVLDVESGIRAIFLGLGRSTG
jgi:hypothetical protein